MTPPGIEPRSHVPLANSLLIWTKALKQEKVTRNCNKNEECCTCTAMCFTKNSISKIYETETACQNYQVLLQTHLRVKILSFD